MIPSQQRFAFAVTRLYGIYLVYHGRMVFTARVIGGAGRGKELGTPTLNLDLRDVPGDMKEGIYACFVQLPATSYRLPAVMHHGPRPVFEDTVSCEVHLLDTELPAPPKSVTVTLVERIRDVMDFASQDALKAEIARDIEKCRAILRSHAESD